MWEPALINEGLRRVSNEMLFLILIKWKPALINEGLRCEDNCIICVFYYVIVETCPH